MQKATVSYFLRGEGALAEVLLYTKLTGAMKGFPIGPGGKREGDETSQETASRESGEETHLIALPEDVEEMGALVFHFTDESKIIQRSWIVMMSRITNWSGSPDPRPGKGLSNPQWYFVNRLPEERFAPGDFLWVPAVLQGKHVGGSITYFKNAEQMLHHNIRIAD